MLIITIQRLLLKLIIAQKKIEDNRIDSLSRSSHQFFISS